MHYIDIFSESRKNPELNVKIDAVDYIRKYKDNPKAYLHMAPIAKVGINPKASGYDSPVGIYAYRIMDIWDNYIVPAIERGYKNGLEFLPYYGGNYLFILESDIDTDFPGHYTQQDLETDIEKLKDLYRLDNADVTRLLRTAKTNQNFRDCPAGYMWGMTKALVSGVAEFDHLTPSNEKKWNVLLRRLGYIGFNDPGMGLIHGAESSQAVFLMSSAFKVIDMSLHRRSTQKSVEIDNKKYIGGRLKNLHMAGIPNVLFYNNTPEDFRSVRIWTVDYIGINDFSTFLKFLPWNAKGIIKNLSFGDAANTFYEMGNVQIFFNKTQIPKNVTIESIYVGGRDPGTFIKYIPENFPVKEIKINRFASNYMLDKLPNSIRNKIVVQ